MKISHVHCRVRDLQVAARWFEKVWQIAPVFNNERMVWLSFGELGVILDAAPIEPPKDRPWGARAAYLKGPGGLTVEIEQLLDRT